MSIRALISRLFLSNAHAEEKQALHDWHKDTKTNLDELKNWIDVHHLSDQLKDYKEVDKKAAWSVVETQTTGRSSNIRVLAHWQKIAAVACILLVSILVFRYNTTMEPRKEYTGMADSNIRLNDGSEVILDKKGKLTYLAQRSVLLDGRAYFDIAPDQTAPFTVDIFHGKVTVLGTEFNINTRKDQSQIYVTEGKVKCSFNNHDYLLTAGDMLTINGDKVLSSKQPSVKPDTWKNKVLRFENHSLHYVLESIADYYELKLVLPDKKNVDACKINTTFENEPVDRVLKELEILTGLSYELSAQNLIIKSFKC